MAVVKVKFTGPANELGVRIDDDVLALNEQGEGEKGDVSPGVHFLTFFAIGPPGTVCNIAITAPQAAQWNRDVTIPDNGVNGGFKKFVI